MASIVVDVSRHQGLLDWEALAAEVDGAIIRMGYGGDSERQDDDKYFFNLDEVRRVGLPFGCYLYSYAGSDAESYSEAQHALRLLPPADELAYPVYLDVEEQSKSYHFRRAIEIWAEVLEPQGYTVGYYSGRYLANQERLYELPYSAWIAEYSDDLHYSHDVDAWQFTSQACYGGYAPLDASYFYIDAKTRDEDDMSIYEPYNGPEETPQSGASIADRVCYIDGYVSSLCAQVAALSAAVETLANAKGADAAAISSAVEDAVKAKLQGLRFTVTNEAKQ